MTKKVPNNCNINVICFQASFRCLLFIVHYFLLELSRYAARTVSGSNVVSDWARNLRQALDCDSIRILIYKLFIECNLVVCSNDIQADIELALSV